MPLRPLPHHRQPARDGACVTPAAAFAEELEAEPDRRMLRVSRLLWAAVLEVLHGEELVMVYGPKGKAKLVPRKLAEQLAGEQALQRATSIEDARAKLGLPCVGFDSDPTASYAGIDRSVAEPRAAWTPSDIAPAIHGTGKSLLGATAKDRAPLTTWTCEICGDVHPIDHAGMMLFACGGMICCSCELRWAEHQGACVPCAELAAQFAAEAERQTFDLTDTPEE